MRETMEPWAVNQKLRNDNEFSQLRRAVESRLNKTIKQSDKDRPLLEDMRNLLGGGLG